MSDALGFPFGMDPDELRDAPLFRELQRVMAASSGPMTATRHGSGERNGRRKAPDMR